MTATPTAAPGQGVRCQLVTAFAGRRYHCTRQADGYDRVPVVFPTGTVALAVCVMHRDMLTNPERREEAELIRRWGDGQRL